MLKERYKEKNRGTKKYSLPDIKEGSKCRNAFGNVPSSTAVFQEGDKTNLVQAKRTNVVNCIKINEEKRRMR
jgi:hypothetical protein